MSSIDEMNFQEGNTNTGGDDLDEAALEAMKARVAEMEAEAAKLREMQEQAGDGMGSGDGSQAMVLTEEEKEEVDARSVYVGNVDYGATPEEIQQHFQSCGTINRITILCDKFTGHPKGFAYVEFADPSLVGNAMVMNESLFRGRLIKVDYIVVSSIQMITSLTRSSRLSSQVTAKRTNLPGMSARGRGRGRGRGRPFRGRGRGRGFRGYY
ncbi:hypothetical protein CBS101457_002272 [Exobasidium rhododendri]|nr:hypothetical protein CBS101457_002272 [Exobasidium rhododendri]